MDDYQNSGVNTDLWIQTDEGVQTDESLPSDSSEETSNGLGLKILSFMKVYWKRRRLAFAVIGTGAVLSVVYALLQANIYTSTTSLMPPDNSSPYSAMLSALTSSSSAASLGSEALGISTPGDLILSILESRTVLDGMIARFDLMHYYRAHVIEEARTALKANTKLDQDRKSGVITIAVTDINAQFACKLAQGYVIELNRVMTENSTSAARRERVFLESRLKDVKRDLDESSQTLSQFSTKSKTIDIPTQAKSMVDAEFKLEEELAEGRGEVAALRQNFSDDNYRVKAVLGRNAELEREINSFSGATKAGGTEASSTSNAYPSIGELPALGVTYFDLDRRVRVDQELWETLTKQYEMARVQEAKEIPTIQILDEPNVPNRKSAPRRSLIVLLCTFLSFVFSCILISGLDHWEKMDEQSEAKRLFAQALAKVKWNRKQPQLS
jgi:uncharacterized protein involved in exopolysaccharide biosynthesis